MKVAIGADHAGFALKSQVMRHFGGVEWLDQGTFSEESCDYPDVADKVAAMVAAGEADTGILICGTGAGMAIAANKVPGIRAVACSDTYTARLTRLHNDANVLCIGARVVGFGMAAELVGVWLNTPFDGGERHLRRLAKVAAIEARGRAADNL